jgi:hypothetical protein
MPGNARLRLIRHGSLVLLAGLFCGLPAVIETMGPDAVRVWHTAHEALIMIGIWMLAGSSTIPALHLSRVEGSLLFWSMLMMGYGFVAALVIGGVIGFSPFSPGDTPVSTIAFLAAILGILGAFLSASLMLMGAHAALTAGDKADSG